MVTINIGKTLVEHHDDEMREIKLSNLMERLDDLEHLRDVFPGNKDSVSKQIDELLVEYESLKS